MLSYEQNALIHTNILHKSTQSYFKKAIRFTSDLFSLNDRTGQVIVDLEIHVFNEDGAYSTIYLMYLFMGSILKE